MKLPHGTIVTPQDIVNQLTRYIHGEISPDEIAEWASALELDEDVSYRGGDEDYIADTLNWLASPEIHGELTLDVANEIIRTAPNL